MNLFRLPSIWLAAGLALWCCAAQAQEGLLGQSRTGFINSFITELMAPLRTRVSSTSVGLTEVRLKDISVHDPKSGQLVLSAKEVLWKPSWSGLTSGDYGEVEILSPKLLVTAETEAAVRAWFKPSTAPSKGARLSKLQLKDASLRTRSTSTLPAAQLSLTVSLSDLDTRSGLSFSALHLSAKEGRLQHQGSTTPALLVPALDLAASLSAAGHLHLRSLKLPSLDCAWTPALEALLLASSGKSGPPLVKTALLDAVELDRLKLSAEASPAMPYTGEATLSLSLKQLRWDAKTWLSAAEQSLSLSQVRLSHGAKKIPFLELPTGRLVVVPDAWAANQNIREITLNQPVLRLRDDLLPALKHEPAQKSDKAIQPIVERLTVTQGDISYAAVQKERIELSAKLDISSEREAHSLKLTGLRFAIPAKAPAPVATVPLVEARVDFAKLWSSHEVAALHLTGGSVEIGDALSSIMAEPSTDAAPVDTPWSIKHLALEDTTLTLQRLAPGLPPVKFALDYEVRDLPLSLSRMKGHTASQKLELSQLAIRSPYEPLREVARLPHSFIEFTLEGLAQRRIQSVSIVSPTLFIGEDLFWYIDYYRKYASAEDSSEFHKKVAVALASVVEADALAVAATQKPPAPSTGWSITTLAVHGGKLVIAPKGYPLPGIPRPFPFSFVSQMEHGEIEAEFEIPSDDYLWEPIQLKLEGLTGKVLFNLPLKDRSNNLTETFTVKRIRYKKLHVEDAHLSVTYDVNGIYGKFGGSAYGGYVTGGFDVYMGTAYPWDGWISGTGVTTTEVTQLMCPAYFLLDGKVNVTAVLHGNEKELFQTDLKFTNSSPGKFSVTALNDMISALPGDWPSYMQDATRIGIETLRDFKYDTVTSSARFFGRSGSGHLKFKGPQGQRNIEVNLYDKRTKQ